MSMTDLKYRIEAGALKGFFDVLARLPLDTASGLGGRLARVIGPRLKAHRTARANIDRFLPGLSEAEKKQLLSAMWDNLGRVAAELPHLPTEALMRRMNFHGVDNLPPKGTPALFFSAHLGNWELCASIAATHGVAPTLIYRAANNPYADAMVTDLRLSRATQMIPKGPRGAVKIARALKGGEAIAMLIDQKMNDGIAVPFFGVPAMTAPAIAQFALRYDLPIIPARVVRTQGAHFDAALFPPIQYEKTGDVEKDTLAIMTEINRIVEAWIREYPEQWFWVHKRWPE